MNRYFLFVTASIAVAFVAGCDSGPYQLTQQEQGVAELGARNWAERTGSVYVNCSGQDSDRDGYVTCGVQNPQKQTEDILCAYKSAPGCKKKTSAVPKS